MKVLSVVVLALSLLCGIAQAEVESNWFLGAGGQLAFPMNPSDFRNGWNTIGIGGSLGIGTRLTSYLSVEARAEFTHFGVDEGGFRNTSIFTRIGLPDASVTGGDRSTTYLSLGVRVNTVPYESDKIIPYGLFGLGLFRLSTDNVTVSDSSLTGGAETIDFDTENDFGFHFGAGLERHLSPRIRGFVEFAYVVGLVREKTVSDLPVRIGVTMALRAR